jgi:malate dehydrogenase (oxaloacetate-decarboxylating)(NADP+)
MLDRKGVIYKGRPRWYRSMEIKICIETKLRTLEEAIKGADVFLGLSEKEL